MNHRLSRENVCEMGLTLARAGLLELTDDQIKNMTVCPVHCYTLGKYWQAPADLPVSKTSQEENGDSQNTCY